MLFTIEYQHGVLYMYEVVCVHRCAGFYSTCNRCHEYDRIHNQQFSYFTWHI